MSTVILKPAYHLLENFRSHRETSGWSETGWETICKDIKQGWLILWQHHGVFTGRIENEKLSWLTHESGEPVYDQTDGWPDDKHLVQLRAFGGNMEYHFWRIGNGEHAIKGRKRVDGAGERAGCIETNMVLRSVVGEHLKKMSDRPKELLGINEFALRTRHYIDHHPETQQAGYIDCRFVGFCEQP